MYASLLVGLAVGVAAPGAKDPPKKEASIVGVWNGEKGVRGGKERPMPPGGFTLTFTADGKALAREGDNAEREIGTYATDSKKEPAEIDLTPPPDKKDGPIKGIYKIDGDTLTLCIGRGGDERPTKLESPEGSRVMLMTLKRVKSDK